MEKINFALLIGYVSSLVQRGGVLAFHEVSDIDMMIRSDWDNKRTNNAHIDEPKFRNVIKLLLTEGQKIEAIKEYRTLFGVSLKEAKDAIEGV